MKANYQVRVYDTSGSLQDVLTLDNDVDTCTITHRVRDFSTLTLGMNSNHGAVPHFILDAPIEVRRQVPEAGLAWYTEYIGLHRTPQHQITEGNHRKFTSYGRGLLDLLRRRSVRYKADTAGAEKGPGPADDIVKQLVSENAGPLATVANGRIKNGVTPGLSVAGDVSAAPSYTGGNAYKNLLAACEQIGQANNVDFDIIWTGGVTFQFVTYYPQLGTDRRVGTANPFVFSPDFDTMFNPSYTRSRTDEVNDVLVLGPGQGVDRDITPRSNSYSSDSPWNLCEEDFDDSGEDVASALNAAGDAVLTAKRPAEQFAFGVIQTPQACYGKHYFLGDLVTGRFDTIQADVKIKAVTIDLKQGTEALSLELEQPPTL